VLLQQRAARQCKRVDVRALSVAVPEAVHCGPGMQDGTASVDGRGSSGADTPWELTQVGGGFLKNPVAVVSSLRRTT
jgi:hypothetical protein